MLKRRKRHNNSKFERQKNIKLLLYLFSFLSMLFYVGVYKVFEIKHVNGEEYEAKAINNQVNRIQDKIINPNRGDILDRNKQAFAVSSTVFNVVLDIRVLVQETKEEQEKTLQGLNEILDIPMETLREYIQLDANGKPVKDTNWQIIKKQVPYLDGKKLQEKNLKCVYTEEDTQRSYPGNSMAASLVGFIRGDSVWGLEKQYNDLMVGVPGRIFRTYESDNSVVTRQKAPQKGYTLITTIDQTIQQFAEEASKSAYEQYECENTAIIVMNPNTGEVLAMAQYPTFDLNDPTQISLLENDAYKASWEKYTDEQKIDMYNKVWRNFNITDTFEPGSIFKPLVVAAAIEEGVISTNDTYYCGGKKVYGKDEIKCHKTSGHGTQTVTEVLANSCNVGMMDIASKMGREKFYKYQRDFGFGEVTGIDLPGEASASNLLYKLEQLNTVELATSSFGQGFNSTAIQDITAFSACINGGNLMKPYIVSQIINEKGEIVKENSPQVVRRVISSETSDYLRKSLESVIKETGTGKKGVIDGYAVGGKTGTAQQGKRDLNMYTLDFIAYVTVENPDIIAMSVINKPVNYKDGQQTPVPMLREVLLKIINYKSIPPSYEKKETDDSLDSNTVVTLSDYTGKSLQDTIKELNGLGLDFELAGSGGDTVTKQVPSGNVKVEKGTKILLYISNSDTGKELSLIPNVVGMTVSKAEETLKSQGFECNIIEETEESTETASSEDEENNNDNKNKLEKEKSVIEQLPTPDIKVEKGTIIKIKIK